jgi:hypothetical protein
MVDDGVHCRLGLIIIARIDHNESGQHFSHPQVFENLMRGTIFSKCETGM